MQERVQTLVAEYAVLTPRKDGETGRGLPHRDLDTPEKTGVPPLSEVSWAITLFTRCNVCSMAETTLVDSS